ADGSKTFPLDASRFCVRPRTSRPHCVDVRFGSKPGCYRNAELATASPRSADIPRRLYLSGGLSGDDPCIRLTTHYCIRGYEAGLSPRVQKCDLGCRLASECEPASIAEAASQPSRHLSPVRSDELLAPIP